MQQFVESLQFNPMKCFYKEQRNGNCLIVENKFNPIHGRLCVHPGTEFKVLIAYFIEINQHFLWSQL